MLEDGNVFDGEITDRTTLEFTCAGFAPDAPIKDNCATLTEVDKKPRLGVKCNDL
jgi:hypothetical protein